MACWNKQHALKIGESVKRHYATRTDAQAEEWALRNCEAHYEGFWYGAVRNDVGENLYCKKWNPYLKERIRAFWGYVSALSGKAETQVDKRSGRVHAISCHHVYYQKSACCFWDEDEKGYYVNLNTKIGRKYPNYERYYIPDGNPNKFVTLTKSEHRKTENNKIHWIKTFEKIIEDRGGKCYLSDEDVEEMAKIDGFVPK